MTTFREELKKNQSKPYEFLLKSSKVPYSLLRDSTKEGRANLLEVEKFEDTFGKKSTRYEKESKRRRNKKISRVAFKLKRELMSF